MMQNQTGEVVLFLEWISERGSEPYEFFLAGIVLQVPMRTKAA
jgi:hypothetical protein